MGIKRHFIHCTSSCGVKMLGKTAARFRGAQTWAFTQSSAPVTAVTRLSESSSGGICQGLSTRWLLGHGMRRASGLREFITRRDGGIDGASLSQVVARHNDANVGGGAGYAGILRANGFRPRQEARAGYQGAVVMRDVTVMESAIPNRGDCAEGLARDLVAIGRGGQHPAYCMISIGQTAAAASAHAMAAIMSANRMLFFDPNAGEYEFHDPGNFRDYMLRHFRVCKYGAMSGDYSIEAWDAPA